MQAIQHRPEQGTQPSNAERLETMGMQDWSPLCHLLADLGLVVFVNAIAADQCWQWQWRGHSGSGYQDAVAAMTAALQYQLVLGSPLFSSTTDVPPTQ